MRAATADQRKVNPAGRVVLLADAAAHARFLLDALSFDVEWAPRIEVVSNIASADAVVFAPTHVDATCASAAQRLRQANPRCLRILVYPDPLSLSARACDFMHQVLSRQRASDELDDRLQRCFRLNDVLAKLGGTSGLTGLESLPSLPSVYHEFVRVTASDVVDFAEIGNIVRHDLAMTARIVGLANSAAFAVGTPITTIERAVGQLGLQMVSALVTATCLFATLTDAHEARQLEAVWVHSSRVAKLATAFAKAEGFDAEADRAELLQAGLLHDIGEVVVMTQLPDVYRALQRDRPDSLGEQLDRERHEFGATHADIGACLLAYWGISARTIDAVAWHNEPELAAAGADPVATLVLAANVFLAAHAADPLSWQASSVVDDLERLFGLDRTALWRQTFSAFLAV
ncbi:MAG: HDOD domain-containing protein [Pseudomonadota bacterium]